MKPLFFIITALFCSFAYSQSDLCNESQKPDDEKPITITELSTLITTPNFYNPNHRYIDELGGKGGRYSAGFLDTWLGETQILFSYNDLPIRVNQTDTKIIADGSNLLYWMTLAMGQEYMNVDMQWMIGFGAKETFSGTPWAGPPFNVNSDGAFGPFEVELYTGLDRAISYPPFYPEYEIQLANALDINTSGIDPTQFMNHYVGADPTLLNESRVISAYMLSITNFFAIYNWYSYAKDLCWHKVIDMPADEYYGLGAMAITYNLGVFSAGPVADTMNKDNYQTTLADPNARDLLPQGNSFYRKHITEVIETVVNRSAEANTDMSINLWDYQIEWTVVERFFLGEGGTVAQQGLGGILRHFKTEDALARQDIMATLRTAFDILKGKAPSSTSNTISYRYDWLVLLRTVKQHFSNDAIYEEPTVGDAALRINAYSNVGGCCKKTPEIEIDQACLGETTIFRLIDAQDVTAVTWEIKDVSDAIIFTSTDMEDMFDFTVAGDYSIEATIIINSVTSVLSENITISVGPVATPIADYIICAEEGKVAVFDLTIKTIEIIEAQSVSDLRVTYHTVREDADLGINSIVNVASYTFTGDEQDVFVRIFINGTNCYDTTRFSLIKSYINPLNIQDQYVICENRDNPEETEISISPGFFDTYSWRNENTNTVISTDPEISISETGSYSLTITKESMGDVCATTKFFEVQLIDSSLVKVTAVFENEDILVTVAGAEGLSYQYALDAIEGPYQDSNRFENVTRESHVVYVKIENGCILSVSIAPDNELIIPEYFTPNGDGFHDIWKIVDTSSVLTANSRIYVFNRFGKLLRQLNPENPEWDGTYLNKRMPSSDYWYSVEYVYENKRKRHTGSFSLIR